MKRIEFLDGLRGVAILLVVCFHAFAKWPSIVPYGNSYGDFPIFKYGYLGVQLFFLISGFVILMSLEKNRSFGVFIYKRWLRLFPAMLVASILVYLTAGFFPERPAGIPNVYSVLPGLTFIDPNCIRIITGTKINLLEGAFWSLFVEFKFYIVFGICYFMLKRTNALIALFSMYILSIVGTKLNISFLNTLSEFFSFTFFGWFVTGSLAYLYFISKKNKYLYFSILVGLLNIVPYRHDPKSLLFSFIILILFFTPIYFEKTRFILQNSVILFWGLISYPLYLIHENAMVSLISKVSKVLNIPDILLPIVPISILVFISYFIVRIAEPFIRNNLDYGRKICYVGLTKYLSFLSLSKYRKQN
jgi:peptidoglycan/LPS O-acetylase OafA/YrhL